MSLSYVFKESFDGMRRARWSTLFSVLTVTIATTLVGIFIVATLGLGSLVQQLKTRVELEVFIDDSLDDRQIEDLEQRIRQLEGVDSVRFVSKEKALLAFRDLFGDELEEYLDLLGSNPLPASFRIHLSDSYRSSEPAQRVVAALQAMPEVRPEDVVFRRDVLLTLERYIRLALWIDVALGIFLGAAAVFLVSNNIRLVIASKRRVIETAQLVGATNALIRRPFLLQGAVEGLLGGTIAAMVLFISVEVVQRQLPQFVLLREHVFLIIAALGGLLGLTGSWASVRRYLRAPLSP